MYFLQLFGCIIGNWVGKSSDFTNPFVCGPAGGKVKKMSGSSGSGSLSHMSVTIHIPNCSNLRANFKGSSNN